MSFCQPMLSKTNKCYMNDDKSVVWHNSGDLCTCAHMCVCVCVLIMVWVMYKYINVYMCVCIHMWV